MSFGVSITDFFVLLKGLRQVSLALRGEAVDGFRRYARTYRDFIQVVEQLMQLIEDHALQDDAYVQKVLRGTHRLLRRFFSKISEFKPYLGHNRVNKSLVGAIFKVRWAHRVEILRELRGDLDRQIALLYTLVATKQRLADRQRPVRIDTDMVPTNDAATPPRRPRNSEYHVILVTRPPVHAFGVISDRFCAPADLPSPIPWDSADPSSIPAPMLPALRFRRHFALCLVPSEVWSDRTRPLVEKFKDQMFWEYHGDATTSSRGGTWPLKVIREINAIEDLGIAGFGRDTPRLCTECKLPYQHTTSPTTAPHKWSLTKDENDVGPLLIRSC